MLLVLIGRKNNGSKLTRKGKDTLPMFALPYLWVPVVSLMAFILPHPPGEPQLYHCTMGNSRTESDYANNIFILFFTLGSSAFGCNETE